MVPLMLPFSFDFANESVWPKGTYHFEQLCVAGGCVKNYRTTEWKGPQGSPSPTPRRRVRTLS